MLQARPPAVAGMFYPGSREELRSTVETLLAEVRAAPLATGPSPGPPGGLIKALIAPHAGYVYSGPVAAGAFARWGREASEIRRIVLLGPAHYLPVRGLALPGVAAFDTPLGRVPVDAELVASILDLPQVSVSLEAHAPEHSLEVELPFLQEVLDGFTVLPLLLGRAEPGSVAEVLERVWGGSETRIVVSSDLSHFLDYESARRVDDRTVERILDLDDTIAADRACGAGAVNGLLRAARSRRLEAELIDLRNSGDTAGDRSRVVGYAAVAFSETR